MRHRNHRRTPCFDGSLPTGRQESSNRQRVVQTDRARGDAYSGQGGPGHRSPLRFDASLRGVPCARHTTQRTHESGLQVLSRSHGSVVGQLRTVRIGGAEQPLEDVAKSPRTSRSLGSGEARCHRRTPCNNGTKGQRRPLLHGNPRPLLRRTGSTTRPNNSGRAAQKKEPHLHQSPPDGTIRRMEVRLEYFSHASRIWIVWPGTGASMALPLPR